MNHIFRGICWSVTWLWVVAACVQPSACESNVPVKVHQRIEDIALEKGVDQLLLLIQKRLAIMHEVAKTKWVQHLPIEDKEREQKILANLAAKAEQYHLDAKWASRFFQAQMDAAKQVQANNFALWETQPQVNFERVFSLQNDLRAYIDQLNQEMLIILSQISIESLSTKPGLLLARPISTRPTDYVDDAVWDLAISPLKCDQ